jgi:arginine/lysine/histidine/glutamine transport system substrate-binding and permease protein
MTTLPTSTWGVLTVGIDDSPPPPMEIGDPASPNFDGYEVDILKGVTRKLGLELRYRRAVWSQILDELANGLLDVVCTAATYTPDRAQTFDYGRPYLGMALSAVIRDDDTGPQALDGVRGRAFAVRVATTAEEYIRSRLEPSSVATFEYNVETYDALAGGRGDVVVDDSPIAAYFVRERPDLRVLGELPDTDSYYAMMFAKGSVLREPIDAAIESFEADGTLAKWRERWFGQRIGA